jgi:hypothetical protein
LNTPILQLMENLKIEVIKTVPKVAISSAPLPTSAVPPTTPPAYTTPSPASPRLPMD